MKDTRQKKSNATRTSKRRAANDSNAPLPGDYLSIRVPIPPASAFNNDRPAGCLLQAQVRHFHHAESARLPKEKRDGRRSEEIRTEAEAAAYIAKITGILHPQRRRKPRPQKSN